MIYNSHAPNRSRGAKNNTFPSVEEAEPTREACPNIESSYFKLMIRITAPGKGVILALIAMLGLSYLFLKWIQFLGLCWMPCFAIVAAFYALCWLLPELVRDTRVLKMSAWLYSATALAIAFVIFCPGVKAPNVFWAEALACVLAAGYCLYPIPLYILYVRKLQQGWLRCLTGTAMALFAIIHVLLYLLFLLLGDARDLAI